MAQDLLHTLPSLPVITTFPSSCQISPAEFVLVLQLELTHFDHTVPSFLKDLGGDGAQDALTGQLSALKKSCNDTKNFIEAIK